MSDDDFDDLELWKDHLDERDPPLSETAQYVALGMIEDQLLDRVIYRKRQAIDEFMPAILGKSDSAVRRMSSSALREAAEKHRKATRRAYRDARNRFAKRIAPLADKLRLTPPAQLLLFYSYLVRSEKLLQKVAVATSIKHRSGTAGALKNVFGGDWKLWWEVLSGKSTLLDCGLVSRSDLANATDMQDVAMAFIDLSEAIESDAPLSACLLDSAVRVLEGPTLPMAQFEHLRTDLDIVLGLIDAPEGTAQILLAGPPGVGKTQFVRSLAAHLNRIVHEVKAEDPSGEPCGRAKRFQHYTLAQKLLTNPEHSLLMFDEAEDVFTGDHWDHVVSRSERHKGWTNRVLESAMVPTIWISNSVTARISGEPTSARRKPRTRASGRRLHRLAQGAERQTDQGYSSARLAGHG